MVYFVDSGNALSSWVYKGTNNWGQTIVSGAAYNYASGTLGYQVQNAYPGGGYPDWRRSFTGSFPRRGICTFAIKPEAPSGNTFIFGPNGSLANGLVDNPFGVELNVNGSVYNRMCGYETILGSAYTSGTWMVWKINYNFDTSNADFYKGGTLVASGVQIANAGGSYYVNSNQVYDFRARGTNYSIRNIVLDDIYISETISDKLLNANVRGPRQASKVCNARIDMPVPGTDIVLINKANYTSNWESFRIVKKLSQLSEFECTLVGIEDADKINIKEDNIAYFFSENISNLMHKGTIKRVQYETEYDCTIKGYGMETLLDERNVNARNIEGKSVFTNTDSSAIIPILCSINDDGVSPFIMPISQNDNSGKISIRFDEETKLKALAAIAEQCGFDWWITHVGDDLDYFNIGLKATTSKMTFYTGGDNQNCWKVNYERDVENMANYVIALGYGDGVNQLSETFYDATPTRTLLSGGVIPGYTSDAYTHFLYHFENNGTDSGPSGLNLGQSGAVSYSSTVKQLGDYSAGSCATGSYLVYTGSPNKLWFNNMPSGTFEAWVRPNTTSLLLAENIDNTSYFETRTMFKAYINSSKFKVDFYNPDLPYYTTLSSTGAVGSLAWNHVAVEWDVEGNYAKLFLNGGLDRVYSGSYYIPNNGWAVHETAVGRDGFTGFIDEMRLSNYPRADFTVSDPPIIGSTQTVLGASGTAGFTAPGKINIGNEILVYSGTTATSFTTCTRGTDGTTAEPHPHNALIYKHIPTGTFWADYKQAESGSSIYANKLKTKKLEAKSIDSVTQLQLWASNYLLDSKDPIIRMTVEVGDVKDVYAVVDVGDWVTVVDTDTGINGDYKVVGMEITVSAEEGERLYLELSSRKSVVLEQFMNAKKTADTQSTYGQGATNIFQAGPMSENSVGGATGYDVPLKLKFYIPEDATIVNKAKVNWTQSDFQGFTSGTNATIYTQSGAMQSVYIKINGTDRTDILGGPWNKSSVSNLDISQFITTAGYHTIELSPAGSMARRLTADGWVQVYIQSK